MRADIEHGPVGDVPEQEIGVLGHVLRLVQRRDLDEPLLVTLPGDVPELARIAAAEETWPPLCSILPPTSKFWSMTSTFRPASRARIARQPGSTLRR